MNNTLLEGQPGIGKTTLLRTIADRLSSWPIGGFFTEEIREKGQRVGFRIETFAGQSGVLSHVDQKSGPRVGRYRVDIPTFEGIGVEGLVKALQESDIILFDEIGKMELFSNRFREIVLRCLDADKPVLATVMSYSQSFVDQIRARPDVQLIKVTIHNRDELANKLVQQITD